MNWRSMIGLGPEIENEEALTCQVCGKTELAPRTVYFLAFMITEKGEFWLRKPDRHLSCQIDKDVKKSIKETLCYQK